LEKLKSIGPRKFVAISSPHACALFQIDLVSNNHTWENLVGTPFPDKVKPRPQILK
jgi:hypothetical protein